jgi:hypothetical protein
VRTVDDFMVPEIRSLPTTGASHVLPDLPKKRADDSGHAYQAPDVDRLPRLRNRTQAARVLAATFARTYRGQVAPDTAVLWLRVGLDGRVASSQLITSTSSPAGDAAREAVPYLRYTPAEKDGLPVPAWISQRLVFVP